MQIRNEHEKLFHSLKVTRMAMRALQPIFHVTFPFIFLFSPFSLSSFSLPPFFPLTLTSIFVPSPTSFSSLHSIERALIGGTVGVEWNMKNERTNDVHKCFILFNLFY